MNRRSFFRCIAGAVPAIATGASVAIAAKPAAASAVERALIDSAMLNSFPCGIYVPPEGNPMLGAAVLREWKNRTGELLP